MTAPPPPELRSNPQAGALRHLRALLVAALLVLGFAFQLYFFARYPQPILFGDPAGYASVGERFQDALQRVLRGESAFAAFESVRGLFYLLGVGALFAAMDALRPGDLGFMRVVLAGFNTLSMAGAFALGRRLSGHFSGGLCALLLAVAYAPFSVQTGRLYPDPVTACLFVWAAFLYADAVLRESPRRMLMAGLTLTAALTVRSQLITYLLLVTALVLAASAWRWARAPQTRRLVCALVLGLSPLVLLWGVITWSVGRRDDVIQLGNTTFRPYYPYGFWQQLETDGWVGPYRFKQEPYYKAMEQEAREKDPDLLRSSRKQWLFTLRYVAARPVQSVLLVLDNAYRLYDRPANDYKWDYPYPYAAQVWLQRAIVVLALAGAAVFVGGRPALGGVFLVPGALAVLHGLVFPWPRYNLPAMPILIGSAGALLGILLPDLGERARRWKRYPVLASMLGVAVVCGMVGLLARMAAPGPARAFRLAGLLALLSVPFLLAAREGARPARRLAVGFFAVLVLLCAAHAARDRRWHEVEVSLGRSGHDTQAVEQEIRLSQEALGQLRTAAETFLMLDLRVPRGDLQGATLTVGARTFAGAEIVPTIPRLRESTSTGGRDRRALPQWWAVPLDPSLLPASAAEPLRVTLRVPEGLEATLAGDRFAGQQRLYEGPSFGDWPHAVALKIEYDGDYRLPVRRELGSVGTTSFTREADGTRADSAAIHRIRLVTLGNDVGTLDFESASPGQGTAAAFAAYSGIRGEATLSVGGAERLRFPLGERGNWMREGNGYKLCYRAEAPRQDKAYGTYYLLPGTGSEAAPDPGLLALRVRFLTGMSAEPMFFVVDRKRPLGELPALPEECAGAATTLVSGVLRVVDATRNNYPEDTGRWTVSGVY